jgi:hypothetical protein
MGMKMMIVCMLFFEHINLQMQDIQTENQSSGQIDWNSYNIKNFAII